MDGHWIREKAGYGIYSPTKIDIQKSKRPLCLQTIFKAELMAIHKTVKIITTKYPNEPTHIFTNSINSIYALKTQLTNSTLHRNHADKTILEEMVEMLQKCVHTPPQYPKYTHIPTSQEMNKLINLLNTVLA